MGHHSDAGRMVVNRWVCAVLVLTATTAAACASGQNAPAPASPTAPSTAQVLTECEDVATAAKGLGDQLTALVAGRASRDQVSAAAQNLGAALDAAQSAIKPESQADVAAAHSAIQQLQTALAAQPLDLTAVGAAAAQVVAAAGKVLAVCTVGSTAVGTPAPAPSR